MDKVWFTHRNFNLLEINMYKNISDHRILRAITIQDISQINRLKGEIERIPKDGPLMIKFGPSAELIELVFSNEAFTDKIRIIQRKFQTPSTGFNESNPTETDLYQHIKNLLKK